MQNKRVFLAFLILWLTGVGAGFARLLQYASTPGPLSQAPAQWPADAFLQPAANRANLVLLAHPRCPCTRASVEELDRLMTRCQGLLAAHVLFYRPAGFPEGWEQTGLWRRAAGIPGVRVHCDEDGAGARRFGAVTSGEVLLYHADGHLLFHGGITSARGHAGGSAGAAAIVALLTAGPPAPAQTPVFGCPLCDPRTQSLEVEE